MITKDFPTLDIEYLESVKKDVSDIFDVLSGFLNELHGDLKNYSSLYHPFLSYFFPKDYKVCKECFIKDIVNPAKQKLLKAIGNTQNVLSNDDSHIEKISQGFDDVDGVTQLVKTMISLVEDVDLHFINIMITSAKAAEEGISLTTIAGEMGKLVDNVKLLSEEFMKVNGDFKNYLESFTDSRDSMLTIRELYLTNTTNRINEHFNGLNSFLDEASVKLNNMMGNIDQIVNEINNIIPSLQNEDLIRQNIEKVIFMNDFLYSDLYKSFLEKYNLDNEFNNICIAIIHKKIQELKNDFKNISKLFLSVQNVILLNENKENGSENFSLNGEDIEAVYSKIFEIRNNMGQYLNVFIKEQKNITKLISIMEDIFENFDNFFHKVNVVIKKFETINMLTRIEIARTGNFSKSIEGSLEDVENLPNQMKKYNDMAEKKYRNIDSYFGKSVYLYERNIIEQYSDIEVTKHILNSISSELESSKKYYYQINDKITDKKNEIKKFWNKNADYLKKITEFYKYFKNINREFDNNISNDVIDDNRSLLENLKDYITQSVDPGDYQYMMIRSLLDDSLTSGNKSEITIF